LALAAIIGEWFERANSIYDCLTVILNTEEFNLSFVERIFLSFSIHRQSQHDSCFGGF
jgi:hypothetical protein